jgi:hypothetical protein
MQLPSPAVPTFDDGSSPLDFSHKAHVLQPVRVVIDGDSLAATDWEQTTWPKDLERAMPQARFVHAAFAGGHAVDVIRRYDRLVHTRGTGGVYILIAGTNDAMKEATLEPGWAALRELWTKARADGFKVIASTVKRSAQGTVQDKCCIELNSRIRRHSAMYDALLDLEAIFPNIQDESLLYDRLHFAPRANAMVLEVMTRLLATILESGEQDVGIRGAAN